MALWNFDTDYEIGRTHVGGGSGICSERAHMGTTAAEGAERLGCQAKDVDGSFWLGTHEGDNHGRSLESY